MRYEINGIFPKDYGNEIAGGDSHTVSEVYIRSAAFNRAKKESKLPKWHEVEVRAYDIDNELQGHWYFKNGHLKTTMTV